jgi:hypothetical protein
MNNIKQSLPIYLKYLINDCYEEDYDPFYAESWYSNYCFEYTFSEWYFLYRKQKIQYKEKEKGKPKIYKHTPDKLIIQA